MMKHILNGVLVVVLFLGGCAVQPVAPVEESTTPVAVAPSVVPTPEPTVTETPTQEPEPVATVPVEVPVTPPVALGGYDLIVSLQAQYGVYAHPATRFIIAPCPTGAHACVMQDIYTNTGAAVGSNIDLYISPDQITPYLLFHEIAHTHGIMDECAADQFSRSVVGPVAGYYC